MKFKKIFAALFLGFVLLLMLRFTLSFFIDFDGAGSGSGEGEYRGSFPSLKSIAYEKAVTNNLRQIASASDNAFFIDPVVLQQIEVYAKEATVNSITEDFDADEARAMGIIEKHQIKVRIEDSLGMKPERTLRMILKVPDAIFDDAVKDLKEIGKLSTFQVTKEDKSEEVRQLMSTKASLEAYKASLTELRKREGNVEEFIMLETNIQQVEKQIQDLGVSLGDYIQDVSYSNISYALVERINFYVDEDEYPLFARAVDALLWTIGWYTLFVMGLAFIGITLKSLQVLGQSQQGRG